MKKSVKFLALILAVWMMCAVLPLTAVAKTLTTTEIKDRLGQLTPLLAIDNLGDTVNHAENSTYTYTPGTQKQNNVETAKGDDIVTDKVANNTWQTYIGSTNLPLNNDSQYTIAFEAQILVSFTHAGFTFSAPGKIGSLTENNTTQSVFFAENVNPHATYVGKGMSWADKPYGKKTAPYTEILNQMHKYVILLNKSDISVYIDGALLGTFSIASEGENYYTAQTLALGFRARCNSTEAGNSLVTIRNIKVYDGIATDEQIKTEVVRVNNYQEGDVLLRMNHLFSTEFTSDYTDLTVTANRQGPQNVKAGENADEFCINTTDAVKDNVDEQLIWTMHGVNTNLPLNESSRYTIEFYINNYTASNIGFCWSVDAWNNTQGIYYYPNSLTTIKGYSTKVYNTSNPDFSKVFTSHQDNSGYTRFTVEINGYTATAFIGGVEAATFDFNSTGEGYTSSVLGLAIKAHPDYKKHGTNPIASVKNITVYAGNVARQKSVEFVQNGTVLDNRYLNENTVITEFPAVTPAPGNVAVWFYQGTNIVVTAPYTVVHDVTLEVREFSIAMSRVVAAQCTAATQENTQSVRLIAAIQSLQAANAGFEVVANYMENGQIKEKSWNVETTAVYSTINAAQNGSVKTVKATELGGTYLIALSVDEVPTNIGQIDFHVRSYMTVNGEKVYSDTAVFTFHNGEFTTALPELKEN